VERGEKGCTVGSLRDQLVTGLDLLTLDKVLFPFFLFNKVVSLQNPEMLLSIEQHLIPQDALHRK